ncbi:hypothetical protein Bca4012_070949 [Brassica carinata]
MEGGGDKYEALLGVVEGIKKELSRLNKVVEKQGRLLRKFKAKIIGKFSSSKLGGLRSRKKSAVSVEPGTLFGGSDLEGTDNSMEYWVPLTGLTSVSQDFGDLNRLVGVITRGVTGTVAEKEVGKATEGGAATKDTDGQVIRVCGTCVLCSELVGMCKLMGCLFVSMCAQSMEADGNAMERGNLMEGPNEKWTRQWGGDGGKPIIDCSVVEEDQVNVPIAEESVAALDVKEAKGGGKKGPTVDSLVAEKTVENCPNAEHNVALAKQAVVDEEIVGEEATSEGEGCNSDGNGDK